MSKKLEHLQADLKEARQFIAIQAEIITLQARVVSLQDERITLLDQRKSLPRGLFKTPVPKKDVVKCKSQKGENGNIISFPSGDGGAR